MKKTVLITGGNRGLGQALVKQFASSHNKNHDGGWRVLATARNIDSLPIDQCDERFQLDLSQQSDIDALVQKLKGETIACIIHNAGYNPKDNKDVPGYFESTFSYRQFSAKNVAESLLINALHPMELTGKLLPTTTEDCHVIAISSWLGSIGAKTVPGHYGYAGSKALLNMFVKGLSLEFEKEAKARATSSSNRVAVAINPGWMKTDMGGSNAETTPEEVAARIYDMVSDGFLATQNGNFVNTDRSIHEW